MCMMSFVFVVPLLVFLSLQMTISSNVSYLVIMKTLKARVVLIGETFSCFLEPSGRSRLLVVSLIEVRLSPYSLGVSG